MDARDIGLAQSASKYSIDMVKDFLVKFKFKAWNTHSSTNTSVTNDEKIKRAKKQQKIAHFTKN